MSPEHDPTWTPAPLNGWPERRRAEPGNALALKHGAQSERSIEAKAAEIHDHLEQVAPWLAQPEFAPALLRYLRAASREELLHRHIEQMAATKGVEKVASRTWEQATAAARLAAALAQELGLTPLGHARLKVLTAASVGAEVGLEDLIASGRKARLDAEARMAAEAAERPLEPPPEFEAVPNTPDESEEP